LAEVNREEHRTKANKEKRRNKKLLQVVAWKLNLDEQRPVVSIAIKERAWIQLQKPRNQEIIESVIVATHFLHFHRRRLRDRSITMIDDCI